MDVILKDLLDNWDRPIKVIRTGYLQAVESPQAKQSVRFGNRRAFPDTKKVKYVKALADAFKADYGGPPLKGMLRLTILYCFPWTQKQKAMESLGWALTDKHVDVDNLLKPVKDALKKIIMDDDSQVVDVRARKIRYKTALIVVRVDEVMPDRSANL